MAALAVAIKVALEDSISSFEVFPLYVSSKLTLYLFLNSVKAFVKSVTYFLKISLLF